MKILYNHQIFNHKYGGIARYYVELANNISIYKKKEIKIKINSLLFKTNYLHNLDENILFSGLQVPDFRGSARLITIVNLLLSPVVSKLYDPDIIHETYYNYNFVKKNLRHVKKIITVYDMTHEIFSDQFSKNDKTTEQKKYAVATADHIICISKNTQKDLIRLFNVDIDKTSVIYFGNSFGKKKIINFQKTPRPYLLFVGSRRGYKNFNRFIEAYADPKIKNFFDLVIFGGYKLNNEEISLFKKLQISEKNFMQLNGDDVKLAGYYKHASLFVYPSLYEGFGLPSLEAMSYGCPVACSNSSCFPEILDDAAHFFDPYSVESIKNSIISLLYNDKLRSSLILKGLNQVKKFSWEKCGRETYEVYKNVLK